MQTRPRRKRRTIVAAYSTRRPLPKLVDLYPSEPRIYPYALRHQELPEVVEGAYTVRTSTANRVAYAEFVPPFSHFTWAWHTVIMGTGVLAALANAFPYGNDNAPLRVFFMFFFMLDLLLFLLISGATLARYIMFPTVWDLMLEHQAQSMFIGAFPMGATTLINASLVVNSSRWNWGGSSFLWAVWAFWWIDSVLSYTVAFGTIYLMITHQRHTIDKMTAVWLLPIVTLIVASSTGGNIALALLPNHHNLAVITSAFSFTMLAIGLSLALMLITIYLMRLCIHGAPDMDLILSVFVTLGPLGQGGYSLLVNGQIMGQTIVLPLGNNVSTAAGEAIYAVCVCGAYVLWSMGIAWILIACLSIYSRAARQRIRIPFSVAYWGLIFPNGVFAMLSIELASVLDSPFFRAFGAAWSILTFIVWLVTMSMTVPAVINGTAFVAPCLFALDLRTQVPLTKPPFPEGLRFFAASPYSGRSDAPTLAEEP
ncbi:hypothetical protein PUNSTDRAFT_62362 [Punctularia strigosozonata HHB-11173 SS5]|uniref:uncharacterized protein n=1 Tax=Punctularia strigosozonata (strain HHB-11173) TaxID=741275 RepID=UPI000441765A|nr:uncharacterized protein PUNSTDRAFT_62362 [Punctularia strigosozonata HHB-11173 SS5]EIN11985.1 hypothetical protein PUNSTDRAFT_62362 [Punctularia strigosozonata HHB-11173 SS5]